jgi:Ca2+/Na+ antiporter
MALNAAMNLLGGIGTVCAAFLTKKFPPMWALLDYQWLYQTLMIVTIVIGLVCIWSTIALASGKKHAYRNAIIILVVGTIVSGVHMFASLQLRGKAMPANLKFYSNAITLLLFLAFKLPGLRERVDFSRPSSSDDNAATGGLAAIVVGAIVLTTELWVGTSHIFGATNWVHVLRMPLLIGGTLLVVSGLGLLVWAAFGAASRSPQQHRAEAGFHRSLPAGE